MQGYEAKILEASKELSTREKIKVKNLSDAKSLDALTENGECVEMEVAAWVRMQVHNDKSTNKDYEKYVLFDLEGTAYVTGSESFWTTFIDIWNELNGEVMPIKIFKKPSKNYQGKSFLTCDVV